MARYGARVREWAAANHAAVRGGAPPAPFPTPEREDYEGLYRVAREVLLAEPRLPKAERKHWRRQLWVARACLERNGHPVPQ
jgi:hypothetical protein